jgi:hypothetical protein
LAPSDYLSVSVPFKDGLFFRDRCAYYIWEHLHSLLYYFTCKACSMFTTYTVSCLLFFFSRLVVILKNEELFPVFGFYAHLENLKSHL